MTHKQLTQLLLLASCLSTQHATVCMDQEAAKLNAERQYLQSTNLEKITKLNEEPLTDTLREDLKEVVWVAVPNKQTWWGWLTGQKKSYSYKERTLQDARKRWNHKAADVTEVTQQHDGPAIKGPHNLAYWFNPNGLPELLKENKITPVNKGRKKKNAQDIKENDSYAASQSNMLFGKSLQTRHATPANVDDVIKRWQEVLNTEAKEYATRQIKTWNEEIVNTAFDNPQLLDFNTAFKTKSEKVQFLYAINAYKKSNDYFTKDKNPYRMNQTKFGTTIMTKIDDAGKPEYTFTLTNDAYAKIAANQATMPDQHLQNLCDQIKLGTYKIKPSNPHKKQ